MNKPPAWSEQGKNGSTSPVGGHKKKDQEYHFLGPAIALYVVSPKQLTWMAPLHSGTHHEDQEFLQENCLY